MLLNVIGTRKISEAIPTLWVAPKISHSSESESATKVAAVFATVILKEIGQRRFGNIWRHSKNDSWLK